MSEPRASQERLAVLRMIDEGKITAEEGYQLLKALETGSPNSVAGSRVRFHPSLKGRTVRLHVFDMARNRSKATASVPASLLEAGLRIAAHYAPGLQGMNTDQLLQTLAEGVQGRVLEVLDESSKVKVEVFIE